jgi:hypothetical protein
VSEIEPVITPALKMLLRVGAAAGIVSFEPYTFSAVERNLTDLEDFIPQYNRLLHRLRSENDLSPDRVPLFLLTLPYYSSVGYLFDSDDLEFYLRKLDPAYAVPSTFKRANPEELLTGDRIALLTFGLMYGLLDSGFSVDYVNQILEVGGEQRDGLVLSESEQRFIVERIDTFNEAIKDAAATLGPNVHLVDIGSFINLGLTGQNDIRVGNRILSRRWVRGNSFSLDGVHPGYVAQALIANVLINRFNEVLGLNAPMHDLEALLETDPYIDQDLDGWAPGPGYPPLGLTEILFMFTDPDDADPAVQPDLPPDFWEQVSAILLGEIQGVPGLREEAERVGIALD